MKTSLVLTALTALLAGVCALELRLEDATCEGLTLVIDANREQMQKLSDIASSTIKIGDEVLTIAMPSIKSMNEDDMGDYQSKVHVDFERKFDLADGVYPLTLELYDSTDDPVSAALASGTVSCTMQSSSTDEQHHSTADDKFVSTASIAPTGTETSIILVTATTEASTLSSGETLLPTEIATPVATTSAAYATPTSAMEGIFGNGQDDDGEEFGNGDDEIVEEKEHEEEEKNAKRNAGISASTLGAALLVVLAVGVWLFAKRKHQSRERERSNFVHFDDGRDSIDSYQMMRQA